MASAIFWTFTGITAFAGPLTGGIIADYYQGMRFLGMDNLEIVFFISWIIRIIGAAMLFRALSSASTDPKLSTKYVISEIIGLGISHIERPFMMLKATSHFATKGSIEFLMRHAKKAILELKSAKIEIPKAIKLELNKLESYKPAIPILV